MENATIRYLDTEYDCFQAEELRKAKEEGIDISSFSSPDIPYDKMQQIREGLKEGIDLSKYLTLSADGMRQVRIAHQANVDITPFIKEGYEPDQLAEITEALKKQIDVTPYLSHLYRGAAIREIVIGLELGVDVSIYANERYDWRQMREIRLGLESRVAIEKYLHPFFDWQQMREIRIGLEDGLDVTGYAKFSFTALDMQKKRAILLEERDKAREAIKEIPQQEIQPVEPPELEVSILLSEDEMLAKLIVTKECMEAGVDALRQSIVLSGITFGIIDKALEEIVSKKHGAGSLVTIAKGQPVADGADGYYEYLFRTEVARTPKILEDGSVDYQNIEWFETVEAGQPVAIYHSAEKGCDGTSVTGQIIEAEPGKEKPLLRGRGFHLLDDKKTYIASVTGSITLNRDQLFISGLFIFDEVTAATGNIDVDGNVYIRGNIGTGVVVKATGDIAVDGFVEGAFIEGQKDIFLKKGVNGDGGGEISAKGDVSGLFFESAHVKAGDNIYCNYSLNSELEADSDIIISGMKGSLIGGLTKAGGSVIALQIGNKAGLATEVHAGRALSIQKESDELKKRVVEIYKELGLLGEAIADMRAKHPAEARNTNEFYLRLENTVYAKEQELSECHERLESLKGKLKKQEDISVKVQGTIYEGVTVWIDGLSWKAKELKHILIKKKNYRIALYANGK